MEFIVFSLSWPLPRIGVLEPLYSFTLFWRRVPNLFCTWPTHSNLVGAWWGNIVFFVKLGVNSSFERGCVTVSQIFVIYQIVFFNRSLKYGSCSSHSTRTCSMIYRTNMRIFLVNIFWCLLSNFPNLTLFTVLWENTSVYTFITNSHCHSTICRWMATPLPSLSIFSTC